MVKFLRRRSSSSSSGSATKSKGQGKTSNKNDSQTINDPAHQNELAIVPRQNFANDDDDSTLDDDTMSYNAQLASQCRTPTCNVQDQLMILDFVKDQQRSISSHIFDQLSGLTNNLNPLYNKLLSGNLNLCHGVPDEFLLGCYDDNLQDIEDSDYEKDSSNFQDDIVASFSSFVDGPKSVRFGAVYMREYNRTLGDHPDVTPDGPPITIEWDFVTRKAMSVNSYEDRKWRRRERRLLRQGKTLDQVPNLEFLVPRIRGHSRRFLLLNEFLVPIEEILQMENEVAKIAKLREESVSQSFISEKTEELLQSAQRKIRRLSSLHGSNKTKGKKKKSESSDAPDADTVDNTSFPETASLASSKSTSPAPFALRRSKTVGPDLDNDNEGAASHKRTKNSLRDSTGSWPNTKAAKAGFNL